MHVFVAALLALFLQQPAFAIAKCGTLLAGQAIEKYLTADLTTEVPTEAFTPELSELPPAYRALFDLVRADSLLGPRLDRALGVSATNGAKLVALVKDPDTRRLLAETAQADLTLRSADTKARVKAGGVRVDILFIGAGLHEQNMQNALRQVAPWLKTLTTERTELVGSTFALGGYTFLLNSTSRPEDTTSLRQVFGKGDLNYLPGGVIQINQFDSRLNPAAQSMADSLVSNRALSPGELAFETETRTVEDSGDATHPYRGKLADGSSVLARAVVSFGIGDPANPEVKGFDNLYAKAKQEKKPGAPARIMSFEDFLRYVRSTRNPYAAFAGKRVAVWGPGDSGKAVVRWLLRLADPRSYGDDSGNVALVKSIPWHGQPYKDCDNFIKKNRSFYADLGRGFKNGIINPLDKAVEVTQAEDGTLTTDGIDADYIIYTTGYRSRIPDLVRPMAGAKAKAGMEEDPTAFRNVEGYEPSLGKITIARQLIGADGRPRAFFLVGPSAEKILNPEELREVEQNSVANANNNYRAWQMAVALAHQLGKPTESTTIVPGRRKLPITSPGQTYLLKLLAEAGFAEPGPGDEFLIAGRVLDLLRRFDLRGEKEIVVTLGSPDGKTFRARLEPGLAVDTAVPFFKELAGVRGLTLLLVANFGEGRRNRGVRLTFRLKDDGTLNADRTQIEFLKELPEALSTDSNFVVTADLADRVRTSLRSTEYGVSTNGFANQYRGANGYERVAREFFDGDMATAWDTVKAIFGDDFEKLAWPAKFSGTATLSAGLRSEMLSTEYGTSTNGFDNRVRNWPGYVRIAKQFFDSDMALTWDKCQELFGDRFEKLVWPARFDGTPDVYTALWSLRSTEYGNVRGFDSRVVGATGYVKIAKETFGGKMGLCWDKAKMALGDERFANLGWPARYGGETSKYVEVRALMLSTDYGVSTNGISNSARLKRGYALVAKRCFDGEMGRARDEVKRILGPDLFKAASWPKRYDGDETRYSRILDALLDNTYGSSTNGFANKYRGYVGYAKTAEDFFDGQMDRCHDSVGVIFGEDFEKLAWPGRYTGDLKSFRAVLAMLSTEYGSSTNGVSNSYRGAAGYARAAREVFGGDLGLCYDRVEEMFGERISIFGWSRIPPR